MEIIRLYPDMANFTIKAFYEKDAEISAAVQESYHKYFNLKADEFLEKHLSSEGVTEYGDY